MWEPVGWALLLKQDAPVDRTVQSRGSSCSRWHNYWILTECKVDYLIMSDEPPDFLTQPRPDSLTPHPFPFQFHSLNRLLPTTPSIPTKYLEWTALIQGVIKWSFPLAWLFLTVTLGAAVSSFGLAAPNDLGPMIQGEYITVHILVWDQKCQNLPNEKWKIPSINFLV